MFGRTHTLYALQLYIYACACTCAKSYIYIYIYAYVHACICVQNALTRINSVYMFALTPITCMTSITLEVDSKGFLSTMGFQQLYKLLQVKATDRARYCITDTQHSVYTKLLYLHTAAVLTHLSTLPIVRTFFLTVLYIVHLCHLSFYIHACFLNSLQYSGLIQLIVNIGNVQNTLMDTYKGTIICG